jgi:hypothetical protein
VVATAMDEAATKHKQSFRAIDLRIFICTFALRMIP